MSTNKVKPRFEPWFEEPRLMKPGFKEPGLMKPGFKEPRFQKPGFKEGSIEPGFMELEFNEPGLQKPVSKEPGLYTKNQASYLNKICSIFICCFWVLLSKQVMSQKTGISRHSKCSQQKMHCSEQHVISILMHLIF